MEFSECTIGTLVVEIGDVLEVGHIVGLTVAYEWQSKKERGEVIPLVQFVGSNAPRGIHFGNLRKVKNGESFTG